MPAFFSFSSGYPWPPCRPGGSEASSPRTSGTSASMAPTAPHLMESKSRVSCKQVASFGDPATPFPCTPIPERRSCKKCHCGYIAYPLLCWVGNHLLGMGGKELGDTLLGGRQNGSMHAAVHAVNAEILCMPSVHAEIPWQAVIDRYPFSAGRKAFQDPDHFPTMWARDPILCVCGKQPPVFKSVPPLP